MDDHLTTSFQTEIVIARPAEEVWAALTEKSRIDAYYLAPIGADIGPVGSALRYGPPETPMIEGEVLAREAPKTLTHSFAFTGIGAEASAPSEVRYTLAEDAGTTRLILDHTGLEPDSQTLADITMGWPIILEGLKAHLEGTQ